MNIFKDKTILITGASSGIGKTFSYRRVGGSLGGHPFQAGALRVPRARSAAQVRQRRGPRDLGGRSRKRQRALQHAFHAAGRHV